MHNTVECPDGQEIKYNRLRLKRSTSRFHHLKQEQSAFESVDLDL